MCILCGKTIHSTLLLILLIIIIGIIVIVVISHIENKKLRVTTYHISDVKIPRAFQGYKIVMLSDLHNNSFGINNVELLAKIDSINPDIVILAGDMMVGRPNTPTKVAENFVNALVEKYPVYYGIGNHELRVQLYDKYKDMWEKYFNNIDKRVVWLDNKKVYITIEGENICLYGLDIDKEYYSRHISREMDVSYIEEVLGDIDSSLYNIMIAHNPEYFDTYAKWGADLTLSGHNHGGIVNLPFVGGVISTRARLFPKYDRGLFTKDYKKLILSSGLGSHTIKISFNNIPEIIDIRLSVETNEEK